MGKILDVVLGLLWLFMAVINFVIFVIAMFTGGDTTEPAIWFAISVLFLRWSAHDIKERV